MRTTEQIQQDLEAVEALFQPATGESRAYLKSLQERIKRGSAPETGDNTFHVEQSDQK